MAGFDMYTIGICALVLIFGFAVFYYFFWSKPAEKESFPDTPQAQAPSESSSDAKLPGLDTPNIVLFHGDKCPHCHAIMPAWKQAKQNLAGKIVTIDLETKAPQYKNFEPVKGVPTIRLYPNGVVDTKNFIEYNGDRSAESISQFALSGN